MIVALDLAVFVILLLTAVLALRARDLLTAVALLATYSLFTAVLFTGVSALDVALVEAALGAGLTGVLLIAAILLTTRRSTAVERPGHRVAVGVLVAGFLALMTYASSDLPARGAADAPGQLGVSAEYIENALEQTETPNVVTALLADYRSLDTLGETLVIVTAALGAALVLRRRGDDESTDPAPTANDVPDDHRQEGRT